MKTRITWLEYPEFKLISNGGNWDKFECIHAGSVLLDDYEVKFPLGWETDVTSSPPWARSLVPQLGAHAPASLLHDRMLDLGWCRDEARRWMGEQLRMLSLVSCFRRRRMISAVWLKDQFKKRRR